MSDTTVSQVREEFEDFAKKYPNDYELDLEDEGSNIYFDYMTQMSWLAYQAAIATMQKELAECQLANKQMREAFGEALSVLRSINASRIHEVNIKGDDEPCYWQRKEWVDWAKLVLLNCEALSLPSTTDALDSYVSEAVKVERNECAKIAQCMPLNSDKAHLEYRTSDDSKAMSLDIAWAIRARNEKG